MNILVTGSEGLIGKPLCRLLEARGDEVTPYDIIHRRDILERRAVDKYVGKSDAVIHLAAQSGVEAARTQAYKAWALNFTGTLNVLEACRQRGKPVVIASSNHIYGHGDAPVKEDSPQIQLDTYSATKHACDLLARSYAHNYGLRVAVMRNTNCFGPDDPHYDHIVPGTILSLLRGERPVIKSDGKRVKSYLYVDDVAEAYIAALDWLIDGGREGEAFNVSGERVSVLDLVERICRTVGNYLEPIVIGEPNDQADEWLDDSKFREATGWEPRHTLDEALALTVEGFKARVGEVVA